MNAHTAFERKTRRESALVETSPPLSERYWFRSGVVALLALWSFACLVLVVRLVS